MRKKKSSLDGGGGSLLHYTALIAVLLSTATAQDRPVKYNQCTVVVEEAVGRRFNAEPSLNVFMACFNGVSDDILIEKIIALSDITPDTFKAPGTPVKLFTEAGALVHISDYEDGVFELYDSVFDSLTFDGLAPLVVENARVRLVNGRFSGNLEMESGGIMLKSTVASDTAQNALTYGGATGFSDEDFVPKRPETGPMIEIIDIVFENLGNGAILIDSFPYVHVKDCHFTSNDGYAIQYSQGSTVFIEDSIFENDSTRSGRRSVGGIVGVGPGGLFARGCTFKHLYMGRGGAVNWKGATSPNETILQFSDCHLLSNRAVDGGAFHITGATTMTIRETTFESNVASSLGGAICLKGDFFLTISGSSLSYGSAISKGGGLFADYRGPERDDSIVLLDSVFEHNTARDSGGGAYINGKGLTGISVKGGKFLNNSVVEDGAGLCVRNAKAMSIMEATFIGNYLGATTSGAAIYGEDISEMLIHDSLFKKNKAGEPRCTMFDLFHDDGGGALALKNKDLDTSTVMISNSRFDTNYAKDLGGHLKFEMVHNVTITDSDFTNGAANRGGSIDAISVGTLTVQNSKLIGNRACGWNGGAMRVTGSESVLIENCDFKNNNAGSLIGDGGVMEVIKSSSLRIVGTNFTGSVAGVEGGVLYAGKMDEVELRNCSINKSSASHGGGVGFNAVKKALITGCEFERCVAEATSGGTVEAEKVDELTIIDSVLQLSKSVKAGGAIYSVNSDKISIVNSIIKDQLAANGSAVYTKNATSLSLENTHIESSTARDHGGALHLSNVSFLTVSTSQILNSRALGNGGAIFVDRTSSVVIENSEIDTESADGDGGALYLSSVDFLDLGESKIKQATAGGNGGGVWMTGGTTISLSGTEISGNSGAKGGGLFLSGMVEVTVNGGVISNNTGKESGGGVEIGSVEAVEFMDCAVHNNAALQGGGVSVHSGEGLTITRLNFTDNAADGNGGSVLVSELGALSCTHCKFERAQAGSGGGLHSTGTAIIQISESQFEQCSATEGDGGGLFVQHTTEMDIVNTVARSTNASGNGGAIHSTGMGVIKILGSQFEESSATGGSGGVLFTHDTSRMDFMHTTVKTSSAGKSGGAIYAIQMGVIKIAGSQFDESFAKKGNGGLLAVSKAKKAEFVDTMVHATAAGSSGGAIHSDGTGVITVSNVQFEGCSSLGGDGGALAIHNTTKMDFIKTQFKDTSAEGSGGAIHSVEMGDVKFMDSQFEQSSAKGGSGGLLFIHNGTQMKFENISVATTSAGESGGAVYFNGTGDVSIVDSEFKESTAKGGNGGVVSVTNGTGIDFVHTSVATARAGESGGAIYFNGMGDVHILGSEFKQLTAKGGNGGVLSIANATGMDVVHTSVESTDAGGSGGAIYFNGTGQVNVLDSDFKRSTAQDGKGGVLSIENATGLEIDKIVVKASTAGESGGAVYFNGMGNVKISESEFEESSTAGGNGGALSISNASLVNFVDIMLKATNASGHGGAVFFDDFNESFITRVEVSNMTAGGDGGGLFARAGASVVVKDTTWENGVGQNGGFAYVEGVDTVVFNGSILHKGLSHSSGGMFYMAAVGKLTASDCQMIESKAETGQGGGFMLDNVKDILISNSTFKASHAYGSGGAICTENSGLLSLDSSSIEDSLTETGNGGALSITNSTALQFADTVVKATNASGNGGAIQFHGTGDVNILDSQFEQSTGKGGNGGVLSITNATEMTFANTVVKSATAGGHGGVIYFNGMGGIKISDSQFEESSAKGGNGGVLSIANANGLTYGNIVVKATSADGSGGAIFFNGIGGVTITESQFEDSSAKGGDGGVLSVANANGMDIVNTSVATTAAHGSGGAIYFNGTGDVRISGSQFMQSTANGGNGGVLSVNHATGMSIVKSATETSSAGANGGAIYFNGMGYAKVSEVQFEESSAAGGNGGALSVNNATGMDLLFTVVKASNAGENGGAIHYNGAGDIKISQCQLEQSTAHGGNGGALSISNATRVGFINSAVKGTSAKGNGGAIYFGLMQEIEILDSEFERCSTTEGNGGVLSIHNGTEMYFANISVAASSAGASGGAIHSVGMGDVNILDSQFEQSSAKESGGVLSIHETNSMAMVDTVVKAASAGGSGGAMLFDSIGQIKISESQFEDSSAIEGNGGALSIKNASTLSLVNTLVTQSEAGGSGGAIFSNNVNDTLIKGLKANGVRAGGDGGGLFARAGASVVVKDTTWENGVGQNGGFAYVEGVDTVVVNGSVFQKGVSHSSGGMFYMAAVGKLTASDCQMIESKAETGQGGALMLYDVEDISISASALRNLHAHGSGGAILAENCKKFSSRSTSIQDSSTDSGSGGAVSLTKVAETTFKEYFFEDCRTESDSTDKEGGALSLNNGNSVTIESVKFSKCKSGLGGGAAVQNVETARVQDVELVDSYAKGSGGAMYFSVVSDSLDMGDVRIQSSKAETAMGGALMIQNAANVTLLDSKFDSTEAGVSGGAVSITTRHTSWRDAIPLKNIQIKNAEFKDAVAGKGSGGAILISSLQPPSPNQIPARSLLENGHSVQNHALPTNAAVSISSASFVSTTAETGEGGAVSIQSVGNVVLSDLAISKTKADNGGGISVIDAATATMEKSGVQETKAENYGGGAFFSQVGDVSISELTVESAKAGSGGAIYIEGAGGTANGVEGDVTITDSSFEGNEVEHSGGAIALQSLSSAEIEDVALEGNEAHEGGAVAVKDVDKVTFINSNMKDNKAHGNGGAMAASEISEMTLTNMTVTHNQAHTGGGIHAQDIERLEVHSSEMTDSRARGAGGAIYEEDVGHTLFKDSEVSGNSALEGGGIVLEGESKVQMKKTVLQGNRASDYVGSNIRASCDSKAEIDSSTLDIPLFYSVGEELTEQRSLWQSLYQDPHCPELTIEMGDDVITSFIKVGPDVLAWGVIAVSFCVALCSLCLVISLMGVKSTVGMNNPLGKESKVWTTNLVYGEDMESIPPVIPLLQTVAPGPSVTEPNKNLLAIMEDGVGWSRPLK